jgi:hypothetical protein
MQNRYSDTSAGPSSAMQLVETSSASSIMGGTIELPTYPLQKSQFFQREKEETLDETIKRVIKRHKETLDRLSE